MGNGKLEKGLGVFSGVQKVLPQFGRKMNHPLVPADYYRGNPEDRIAERKEKLVQAVEMRQAYWQRERDTDQGQTLT